MDIGILGGTFDPIHIGHLIVAESVRQQLNLSEVVFIPAGVPWLKDNQPLASGGHRLEMVNMATSSNPHFRVSTEELERPGASYSVDTVAKLSEELGPETNLFFIIGPDALSQLPEWKDPDRLISLCHIVAINRPNAPEVDLGTLETAITGASSHRIKFIDVPGVDISSSSIRQRVGSGLSIRYLVPSNVEEYIVSHGLYS